MRRSARARWSRRGRSCPRAGSSWACRPSRSARWVPRSSRRSSGTPPSTSPSGGATTSRGSRDVPQSARGPGAGWDPAQYRQFAEPRLRPALALLARIPLVAPRVVYDLGCGAGNVTRLLTARWPAAAVTGIDGSAAMLEAASRAVPSIAWVQADLQDWSAPEPADLIFSNAALHWLDGHAGLFPRLLGQLGPGGVLAVQMPRNHAP